MNQNADLDRLRHANASLNRFLDRFSGAPVARNGEEVEALLRVEQALQSVAILLDAGLQSSGDLTIREELARYRENLVSLRCELSVRQQSTTASRRRSYSLRNHWPAAKALRETTN